MRAAVAAAVAEQLKKKTARVSYSEEISDAAMKQAIESLGFEVKRIQKM